MANKLLWALMMVNLSLSLLGQSEATQFYQVRHLLQMSEQFLGTKASPLLICNPSRLNWPQNIRRYHVMVNAQVKAVNKLSQKGENAIVCLDHFDANDIIWLIKQWKPPSYLANLVLVAKNGMKEQRALLSSLISPSSRVFFFDNEIGFESFFVNGQHVERNLVETATKGDQMELEMLEARGFLERRSDLQGLKLSVMVQNSSPFVTGPGDALDLAGPLFETSSGDLMVTLDKNMVEGIFIDVLNLQQKRMNFSSHVFTRYDQVWGHKLENGSWYGIWSTVAKNEADLIVAPLSMLPERLEVAYFLPTLASESYALYVKRMGKEELNLQTFFKPFAFELWLGILLMVLLLGLALTVAELLLLEKCIRMKCLHCVHLNLQLAKNMWRVFNSLLGGRTLSTWKITEKNENNAYKGLLFVSALFGVAILACFRSSITSELSVLKLQLPFNSLEGLLQSNYKLTSSRSYEALLQLIESSGTPSGLIDRVMEKYGQSLQENPIQRQELDTKFFPFEHLVYLYSKEVLEGQEKLDCKLQMVWKTENPLPMAPIVPKSSELQELLSFNTELLIENGFVLNTNRRWLGKKKECKDINVRAISLEKLAMPILLMVVVFALSPIFLLFEIIFARL